MLTKGIIESISSDGFSAKVRIPTIHRIANDPLGVSTADLDDATILSVPGLMPVYMIGDVVFVQFENDEIGSPVICGLLERSAVTASSGKLCGETAVEFAASDWVKGELQTRDVMLSESMVTALLNSYSTNITDRSGHWTVKIPDIDRLYDGLTIKVTITTDPYMREGYNTIDVSGLGPQVVFKTKEDVLDDSDSIRGAEYFLTYHSSGLGPYTVTSDLGALPIGTVVNSGWVATSGSGSFEDSPEYEEIIARINEIEQELEGQLTTYICTEPPTLYNYPTNTWEGKTYPKHIGNLAINRTTGDSYRFIAQLTAVNLNEYPYGRSEEDQITDKGITFTWRNGVIKYQGTPSCSESDPPKVSLGNRIALPAGTYTLIASTNSSIGDVGLALELFTSASGNTHYSGGGDGLLDDGYRVVTAMSYDDVSWATAIASGYQTTVTFTLTADAYAEEFLLTKTAATALSGDARLFTYSSIEGFSWLRMSDSELADLLRRMSAAETTITVQGQSIQTIQGQITSKIWETDITNAIDNLKIGGTNLLADSNAASLTKVDADMDRTATNCSIIALSDAPVLGLKYGGSATGSSQLCFRNTQLHLVSGETYTLSFYLKVLSGSGTLQVGYRDLEGTSHLSSIGSFNSSVVDWTQYSATFTYEASQTETYNYLEVYCPIITSSSCNVQFCGMKLEVGEKATPWSETVSAQLTLSNKYTQLSQTVSGITTEVSNLERVVTTKADQSTVTTLTNRVTTVEQTAEGLSARVTAAEDELLEVPWENLTPYPYKDEGKTEYGITWTVNDDDTISAVGTITAGATSVFTLCDKTLKLAAGTYSFGRTSTNSIAYLQTQIFTSSSSTTPESTIIVRNTPTTFTIAGDRFINISCVVTSSTAASVNETFSPMLETGSVAHAFSDPSYSIRTMKSEVSNIEQTAEQISTTVEHIEEQLESVPYENLLPWPYYYADGSSITISGTVWYVNSDHTVTGTKNSDLESVSTYPLIAQSHNYKLAEGTYTISGAPGTYGYILCKVGSTEIGQETGQGLTFNITSAQSQQVFTVSLCMPVTAPVSTVSNFAPMLVSGESVVQYVDPEYSSTSMVSRITSAESDITQNAQAITTKVSQTDYTGNTIASLINQSATTVSINAEKINLNGSVTISDFDSNAKGQLTKSSTSKTQFYLSTSSTTTTGGSWSDSAPTWIANKYVWTRLVTTVVYVDDTTSTQTGPEVYDKTLTDSLSSAAAAQTAAATAMTKANTLVKTTVPIYYRSTTSSVPSKPTAQVTTSANDTDNLWTLRQVKPKNGRYYFQSYQQQLGDGNYSWTNVRSTSELDTVASWCNSTDSTYIDGSHLYTGTVTTNKIAANAITADKISVNNLQAISASLAGWQLSNEQIYRFADSNHKVGLNAPSNVTTDKMAFFVYDNSSGTDTYPFSVTYGGKLIANNATITGAITATSGDISGWTIGSESLYKDTSDSLHRVQLYAPDSLSSTSTAAIRVRERSSASADWSNNFYITYGGKLYASNAEITGKITATSGTVGGWTLTASCLHKETSSGVGTGIQAPSSGTYSFAAGYTSYSDWSTAPFRVTHSGACYASNLNVTGGSINIQGSSQNEWKLVVRNSDSDWKTSLAYGQITSYKAERGQSMLMDYGAVTYRNSDSSNNMRTYVGLYNNSNYYGYAWIGNNSSATGITLNNNGDNQVWAAGFQETSDARLKNVIGELPDEEAHTLLTQVKPINFTWKGVEDSPVETGFKAQEFRSVLKENGFGYRNYLGQRVNTNNPEDETTTTDLSIDEDRALFSLDYSKLTSILWKGWQIHEEEITRLKKQLEELTEKLSQQN